jgi:hypothetical protein
VCVLCAVALPLEITLGAVGVGDAVDDLVHQHRLKNLGGVVLGLQAQLLGEAGVAVAQGAGGVCEGTVVVLAPVWAPLVPASEEKVSPKW